MAYWPFFRVRAKFAKSPPPLQAALVRGSPETVAHLASQILQRLDGQSTRFDIALTPQHLGRVDVRIEIGRDGALKARLSFDSPTAAHDLSARQSELRSALQSAGFDVSEGALSFDVASGGQGGAGGDAGQAFAERGDNPGARQFQSIAEAADPSPLPTAYGLAAARGGLDIRV